jgi:hypothetical protein
MFFFLLSNNRPSLVVIYLMLVKSLFFEVSVAPHYVSPTSLLMPVTTRSQSKCLQQAIGDHSFIFYYVRVTVILVNVLYDTTM